MPEPAVKEVPKGAGSKVKLFSIFPNFRARLSVSEFNHIPSAGGRHRKEKISKGVVVVFKNGEVDVTEAQFEQMKEKIVGYGHKWVDVATARGWMKTSKKNFAAWTRQCYIKFLLARKIRKDMSETEFAQEYSSKITGE